MLYQLFSFENVSTVLGYVFFAAPFLVFAWLVCVVYHYVMAVAYVPKGRWARRAELGAWTAYYERIGEMEALQKKGAATKERLQAEMKTKIAIRPKGPDSSAYSAQLYLECTTACLAEDEKVREFGKVVKAAEAEAKRAYEVRSWYTSRTWRDLVMTVRLGS